MYGRTQSCLFWQPYEIHKCSAGNTRSCWMLKQFVCRFKAVLYGVQRRTSFIKQKYIKFTRPNTNKWLFGSSTLSLSLSLPLSCFQRTEVQQTATKITALPQCRPSGTVAMYSTYWNYRSLSLSLSLTHTHTHTHTEVAAWRLVGWYKFGRRFSRPPPLKKFPQALHVVTE